MTEEKIMKKFLKITGIFLISIIIISYLAFLFVLPNVIDLNKYKPEIQKLAKEQVNLNIDFENPKLITTPLLSAGITADNIKIMLPDNSEVITSDNIKAKIALPSLILLTVKIPSIEINNPKVYIDIVDGKAFKAVQAYEEILNKKENNIEANIQTAQKPLIDPSLIKIVIPAIKLNNYVVSVNDLQTNDFLKLTGEELVFGYFNGKNIGLKTNAELYLNEVKNVTANIDINTFIPQQSKLDKEDDKAQRIEIPFINPVAMYKSYDLKTDIDSKIKIKQKNNVITSKGYLNIDNFTLNLAGTKLPESNLHVKTSGTKVNIDTNLHVTEEEKLSINGFIKYADKPGMDLNIQSNEIKINDILNLIKATLNSLHIKHELNPITGEGYLKADTNIKTNFKKLKSNGNITIKDFVIKNTAKKLQLAKINSIISLDNSILKFMDTSVEIAETIFKIDGTIDEKSVADINIIMEKMPLKKIFTMFLTNEINNNYSVQSGEIDLKADIKGELKKAAAELNISLNNLSLTDKINKINYLNNLLTAEFKSDFKNFTGEINNSDYKMYVNNTEIKCDKFKTEIGAKDIIISPAKVNINNSTTVNISGAINNYQKNPIFNFDLNGDLKTKDLKQLTGDAGMYIDAKGIIPLKLNLNGDKNKQTLSAEMEADKNNYITPIEINNLLNKNTSFKAVVDFKGDRLKIKDTGVYIKTTEPNPEKEGETITKYEEVVGIDGTITKLNTLNPNINLIKVKMPAALSGKIYIFPQSKFDLSGKMFIFGDLKSPRIRGEYSISNLSIPELMIKTENISAKFEEDRNLNINIKNLLANDSDYNILINADLNPSDKFIIKNMNLISNITDADKLMKVSEASMKYVPNSSNNNGNNSQAADIPVTIRNGNIEIKQIKSGNIKLTDTAGNISLLNNIFYINNLITSAFKGKIKGDISMNLLSNEIKADVEGKGLDVEQTLLDTANMKDTLTGVMDFDADISLKGTSYEEQMKSLKGKVDFLMNDGQLGPFGKLENLIMAENIRENDFFKSTIGGVLNSLLSFDTSHYNILKGHLTFNNGIVQINPINSTGNIMATYIFGDFNLLKNNIDIKLRGRLGSQVSDSLGPVALLNPINLMKATPGMSLVMGKLFFLFTEVITEQEMAQIPSLGKEISDLNATKFQVVIRGNVEKPLTLIKSFKWLVLSSDMEQAQEYLKSIPQDTKIPEELQNLTTMDKEEVKEKVKETAKKKVKEKASELIPEETKAAIEETKSSIEENKENISKLKSLFKNKEKTKEETKEFLKEKAKKAAEETLKELAQPQETEAN